MKKPKSVDEYIESNKAFSEPLQELRAIICSTELKETIKWSLPVYTLNGKNVIGLGGFKNHFGIWFFNGALLKDEAGVLVNAQDGKTKAMRQMKFNSADEINKALVLSYINEAIDNQKLGKVALKKPSSKKSSKLLLPDELNERFKQNEALKTAYDNLSLFKRKEFAEYISEAKRESTKANRLQKIEPMILKGIGLNDKYRN